jgi:branched-chain amino acid transport system ATP-binding protein
MSGLQIRDVTKTYDGFRALGGVSFDAPQGRCVAVVGPNGAGKSTLFAIVGGQTRPDSGSVQIDGVEATKLAPHRLSSRGLARTFQVARLFPSFTVQESVVMARQLSARTGLRSRDPMRVGELQASCREVLELVRMVGLADRKVGGLTQGERKRLEFGMAVAQRPRVLVLDEPTAGMNRSDVETVMEVLRETKASSQGLTILLSSHDMDVVFGLADHLVVMAQGQVLVEGEPREVANDQRVADVYLGSR